MDSEKQPKIILFDIARKPMGFPEGREGLLFNHYNMEKTEMDSENQQKIYFFDFA